MRKNIDLPDDKDFILKLRKLALSASSVKAFMEKLIIDHVNSSKIKVDL